MFKSSLFKFSLALALGAFAASSASVCFAQASKQTTTRSATEEKKSEANSRWTWTHTDDGRGIKVAVENKVVFTDDYSDVREIPSDGRLIIEDNRAGGVDRRYRVERGAGGELVRTYRVNGAERQLDAEGREWLRRVMLEAVRQGGLEARPRAQRILRERGARALAEELTHVRGDYVRRIYFEELMNAPGLDEQTLADALRNASRISSDYERAQLLIRVDDTFLAKDRLVPAYFEAVGRISSDYERRRVLLNALKRAGLGGDALVALVHAASRISSDYEKATVLIQVARLNPTDSRVRGAFAEAVRTITSDYERGRVEKVAARSGAAN
ncbi:MAG TPA: hypothetical protein VK421_09180 [Pyrinomonadaceae bacterium]|nr:hypothetical protein [Pyrinomonadaceae bacterium]